MIEHVICLQLFSIKLRALFSFSPKTNKHVFEKDITNWEDWSKVFQSIPEFKNLISLIFQKEKISFLNIQNLTPGTNAVFRVDNYVIKIYAPKESGLDSIIDYTNEKVVCSFLTSNKKKVSVPKLIRYGSIEDKYLFYYLIFEFIDGEEATVYLQAASFEQKKAFVQQLHEILKELNQATPNLIEEVDIIERCINGERILRLPTQLQTEIKKYIQRIDVKSNKVLVHGDLNPSNILVDNHGKIKIIDFADACLAPRWYEFAPIIFELFKCDPILCKLFVESKNISIFIEELINSLCVHDFGPDIIIDTCKRQNIPVFESLDSIQAFLKTIFQ